MLLLGDHEWDQRSASQRPTPTAKHQSPTQQITDSQASTVKQQQQNTSSQAPTAKRKRASK